MEMENTDPLAEWQPCSIGARVLRYARVSSTQDVARRLIQEGIPNIAAVIAGYQTAGRGRFGRAWVAPPGTCLLVTYPIPLPKNASFPLAMLSFAAGLCVALAVEELAGIEVGLKWPNDILISGKKASGVLIEAALDAGGRGVALVGIGVNGNVTRFPGALDGQATSLLRETGRVWDLDALERTVRAHLEREVRRLYTDGHDRLLAEWRSRDRTGGARYRIRGADGGQEGSAVGVSDTGALILLLDGGSRMEVMSATALRPVGSGEGGVG
ncbi:MAG: biotin--[acetyl-CoA-carboxylase] ligase [Chthonomonadales bacterium]